MSSWGEVAWLMGRTSGIGLIPVGQETSDSILLVFGNPDLAVSSGNAYVLDREALDDLERRLRWFRESGRVSDPAGWPSVGIWGEGSHPTL